MIKKITAVAGWMTRRWTRDTVERNPHFSRMGRGMLRPPPGPKGGVRMVLALAVALLLAGAVVAVVARGEPESVRRAAPTNAAALEPTPASTAGSSSTALAHPGPAAGPDRAARAGRPSAPSVTVRAQGTYSWALVDRATGVRFQSQNGAETSYTESMVKIWLAADHLKRAEAARQSPSSARLRLLHDDPGQPRWCGRDDLAHGRGRNVHPSDDQVMRTSRHGGLPWLVEQDPHVGPGRGQTR